MNQELIVKVGMADLNVVSSREGASLRTTGLGSCVGLTLYDPIRKIAGMAHVMLPSSEINRNETFNTAKYADTAIPELIQKMLHIGAAVAHMEAKLAGGAQMFNFMNNNDSLRIGPRNVDSCKEILGHYRIPIKAEDTGGNYGRTIELYSETGKLLVRSVQNGIREL